MLSVMVSLVAGTTVPLLSSTWLLLRLWYSVALPPVLYIVDQSSEHHVTGVLLGVRQHVDAAQEEDEFDADETQDHHGKQAVSYVAG